MIDLLPNATIVTQWVIFMTAFLVLHFGVFRPTLKIIEQRTSKTAGEKETARQLEEQSKAMELVHSKKMEEARLEGIRKKDVHRTNGERFVEDLLKKARAEIEQNMERSRAEIDRQSKEAALQLRQQARELGHDIAVKVLERNI
ncbi:MAG TPA: ATP synthase F0 subunit B [bacterium]|nr:ATP synthase F0 subunit B [bacterium]